jgi:AraC-binding-like domain
LPFDLGALSTFDSVVNVRDPREMDVDSRVSRRQLGESKSITYRLQDRSLMRTSFDDPISTILDRLLGSMQLVLCRDRFATQVVVGGDGVDSFCFSAMLCGKATVVQRKSETTIFGTNGAAWRLSAGNGLLASDINARQQLWIKTSALEHALEGMLGERLRKPLEFIPGFDWAKGLAASLRSQIDLLVREMTRRDGVADNPIALASLTDLIVTLVLRGKQHPARCGSGLCSAGRGLHARECCQPDPHGACSRCGRMQCQDPGSGVPAFSRHHAARGATCYQAGTRASRAEPRSSQWIDRGSGTPLRLHQSGSVHNRI